MQAGFAPLKVAPYKERCMSWYVAMATHLSYGDEALAVLESVRLIGGRRGGGLLWQYERLVSVTNGRESAAAGWQWAVGWLPWQPASNPVAKGKWAQVVAVKVFSVRILATSLPHPPTQLTHCAPWPVSVSFPLHPSAREDQTSKPTGRRQKWWKRSINITEIPSGSAPWHVWRWMGHDAWRPAETCHPRSLIWRSPRWSAGVTFWCRAGAYFLSTLEEPQVSAQSHAGHSPALLAQSNKTSITRLFGSDKHFTAKTGRSRVNHKSVSHYVTCCDNFLPLSQHKWRKKRKINTINMKPIVKSLNKLRFIISTISKGLAEKYVWKKKEQSLFYRFVLYWHKNHTFTSSHL